jgi:hypothetical protein
MDLDPAIGRLDILENRKHSGRNIVNVKIIEARVSTGIVQAVHCKTERKKNQEIGIQRG